MSGGRSAAARGRGAPGCCLALTALCLALYLPNACDYFLGDDFDLVHSFHGESASYFVGLLWSNESGDVWKSWGIDPALGRGYLRPLKIWLLALDFAVWGTSPLGFHLTSTAFLVANVLLVFAILRRALPERLLLAFGGACAVAVHPVFAEVVPFVTAREELAATAFGLASFLAFLRFREDDRSPALFHLCYGLALLTKESSIAFLALPLGWELAHGRLWPPTRDLARGLARTYAPTAAILVAYFALRWIAFGNLVGGDGQPTHYLSAAALVAFHARFFRSLVDPTLFAPGGIAGAGAVAGALALAALCVVALGVRRIPRARASDLLFYGPLWYLGSTAILHGTYFAVRHNLLPVIGLLLFVTLALEALLESGRLRRPRACALALLGTSTALFLPATLATNAEWRAAAAAVEEIRARIEERTAGLPPGSAVSLAGVPQWVLPPFFFGWGLRSALAKPFTESDLASISTVIDARNLELSRARVPIPERFDLVIEFDPREFVTPELEARYLGRLRREGVLPVNPARRRGSRRRSPRRGARSRAGRGDSSRRRRAARARRRRSA